MPTLRSTVPVLASLDIAKTIEFYVSKLGFEEVYVQPEEYGIAKRDDISIHFWACDDPKLPQNTSCRVQVDDIDDLYAELLPRGVVHPNGPLQEKPWGSREFAILDSDGNLITFFELENA